MNPTGFRFLPISLVMFTLCPGLVSVRAADAADGDRVQVTSKLPVVLTKRDKTRFRVQIVSYDQENMEFADGDKPVQKMAWSELEPASIYAAVAQVMPQKSGKGFMELGSLLAKLEDGKGPATLAYRRAMVIDPALVKEAKEAIDGLTDAAPSKPTVTPDKPAEAADKEPAKSDKIWGLLPDEQSKKVVEGLKKWSDEAMTKGGKKLTLTETKYFLFYTDLGEKEAAKWTRQLDAMYNKCCEMFGVDKGINVWHGKALVYVFQERNSYVQFETANFGNTPTTAIGLCHSYSDGRVIITFFRQPDDLEFATVLVHEATHGFVHRYRAMFFVPSWINEGLAEFVADDLVPRGKMIAMKEGYAKAQMDSRKSMGGDFFTAQQIDAWQYGVASLFTKFLIKTNKKGYVALLNAFKDGKSTEEAFKIAYNRTPAEVVEAFGKDLRLRTLVP